MVSQGVSMLWSSFIPPKKAQERLSMRMSDLVEHVSKKPIPAWTKNLLVEVMVNDEDDEDVEVSLRRDPLSARTDSRCRMFWCTSKCGPQTSVYRVCRCEWAAMQEVTLLIALECIPRASPRPRSSRPLAGMMVLGTLPSHVPRQPRYLYTSALLRACIPSSQTVLGSRRDEAMQRIVTSAWTRHMSRSGNTEYPFLRSDTVVLGARTRTRNQ